MPSLVTIDGNKITNFKPLPGFDARDGSTYSIYQRSFQYVDTNGVLKNADVEGIHPRVTSVGAQFHYELSDALTVDNNFRYTDMSGNFTTQFLNVATTASVLGSTVNGQTVGAIRYAAGPSKGQAYTGTYLNNNPNINTVMKDMGSIANNLALTGRFDVGAGKITVQASDPDDVTEESDPAWLEAGGNGNPMRSAKGGDAGEGTVTTSGGGGAGQTKKFVL